MRVITGSARGRSLKTLEGLAVRPTTARVKEAVFSIVQFEIPACTFLDLFAGSGQMGIEALSRGASLAVFVDESRQAQTVIRENLNASGLAAGGRVVAMTAQSFLASTRERFDVAFLDPPYHSGLLEAVLPSVAEKMQPGGVILCEHARTERLPETAGGFVKGREYRYGKIQITAYRAADGKEA